MSQKMYTRLSFSVPEREVKPCFSELQAFVVSFGLASGFGSVGTEAVTGPDILLSDATQNTCGKTGILDIRTSIPLTEAELLNIKKRLLTHPRVGTVLINGE